MVASNFSWAAGLGLVILLSFVCRMTKFDIRNYFQSIYGVSVAQVDTRIQLGMFVGHTTVDKHYYKPTVL